MPDIIKKGKIWLPTKTLKTYYDIKISGTSVKPYIMSAYFTKVLCPKLSSFRLSLNNNNRQFNYTGNETVILYMDRTDGTTERFEGKIVVAKTNWGGSGNIVDVEGNHISNDVVNVNVTEEYTGGTNASDILKAIIDKYLTGFTYSNVNDNTFKPNIKWVDKPLWDCVYDLCLVDKDDLYDCYVDDDKDFNYFKVNSIVNEDENIVWKDNLFSVSGFGDDIINVKNKVRVYGKDSGGLPVISTSQDSDSQSEYGLKEKIIKRGDLTSYSSVNELSDSNLNIDKDVSTEAKTDSRLLITLNPGDNINITNPPQNVRGVYKIFKFTHSIHQFRTTCMIENEYNLADAIINRSDENKRTEDNKNPHNLNFSYNLPFDDDTDIDSMPSNMDVQNGELIMTSGNTGTMISKARSTSDDITKFQVQSIGESLANAKVSITCNNGNSYVKDVVLGELYELGVIDRGKSLRIKIEYESGTVVIKSIAALYS